jgi:hypothetical protein
MPAPLSLRIKEWYMAKRANGLSQQVAADAAGISVRSAQRIDRGELQPEGQQQQRGRHWRTRADPLAEVWESVLVPMLEKAPQLEPQTLLLQLEQLRPGEEWYRRKRTLQRRVEQWRALHGPAQEVMFLQEHRAGVLGISDFTLLKGEPITVAGEVLEHRLFHFRLPYSGWCHVAVIHGGESFVALSEALQNALGLCGGVPAEHRTDSLSACFRNRDGSYAGDYTSRYRELCAHLGVIATRNNRGVAHENGAIEGPHRHWKHRLEQQLIQRGSRDFATEAEYRQLVAQVTNTLNSRYQVQGNLEIERLHLHPLPVERFADYEPMVARVRSTSTIEVRSVTYSVPSRLIGQQLTVHLHHDRLDLFLRSQFVETLPRLHRRAGASGPLRRIDFRHVIESLRRKPRALLRAQLQADILPDYRGEAAPELLLPDQHNLEQGSGAGRLPTLRGPWYRSWSCRHKPISVGQVALPWSGIPSGSAEPGCSGTAAFLWQLYLRTSRTVSPWRNSSSCSQASLSSRHGRCWSMSPEVRQRQRPECASCSTRGLPFPYGASCQATM